MAAAASASADQARKLEALVATLTYEDQIKACFVQNPQ